MRPKPCPLLVQMQLEHPVCPVHGCRSYTQRPGLPCKGCRSAFGCDSPSPRHRYMRRVPSDA